MPTGADFSFLSFLTTICLIRYLNTTQALGEASHLSSAESPFSKIVPDLVNIALRSSSMDDPLWLN